VADLISKYLGDEDVVVKPDAGTHGNGVRLASDRGELEVLLSDVQPSITNPSGVVAQELIPKWFYDMRILVAKEKGKPGYCPPTCLVRAGFKEFRTNTFLGNMVFRLHMPESVRKASVKAGEVLAEGSDAWVLALDAMPYLSEEYMTGERELRGCFDELVEHFNIVQKVKAIPDKKADFEYYTDAVTTAYESYMDSDPYRHIQGVVQETLESTQDQVVFHEGNSCPEFWEQTRVVGGINVAELLLNCAQSLV
jgi:glutathione synthase/RimK-type ligase-like ATP-grasp enzyme